MEKEITKTITKKEDVQTELDFYKARIAELEAQLKKEPQAAPVAASAPIAITIPSTDVTVVYCSDSLGHAEISNLELNFTRFGEEFTITRYQFDELVGKYRSWFDRGILAVSYKNVDIAATKGVKTDKELKLDSKTLESIGSMSAKELEKLWNTLTMDEQRYSIVSYFKRKFIENDKAFYNREKVDLMNRLTNGGFAREQDELSGRYHINPTEMK